MNSECNTEPNYQEILKELGVTNKIKEEVIGTAPSVIPAKAGISSTHRSVPGDSRFRGNDRNGGTDRRNGGKTAGRDFYLFRREPGKRGICSSFSLRDDA